MNDIPPLNAAVLLKRHGLRADKRLGQNFLQDPLALEKIAAAAEIQKTDSVLEIGAGLGSLTRYLSVLARDVTTIELDSQLASVLEDVIKSYINVHLVSGDILELTPKE